jgi:hypothetical protein
VTDQEYWWAFFTTADAMQDYLDFLGDTQDVFEGDKGNDGATHS